MQFLTLFSSKTFNKGLKFVSVNFFSNFWKQKCLKSFGEKINFLVSLKSRFPHSDFWMVWNQAAMVQVWKIKRIKKMAISSIVEKRWLLYFLSSKKGSNLHFCVLFFRLWAGNKLLVMILCQHLLCE